MKMLSWKRIFIILCLIFILPACQLGSTLTSQESEQSNSPEAIVDAVQETLAAGVQEEEPLAESTLPAQPAALSQEELKEKWQTPLLSYAFLSGICGSVQEIVEQQISGNLSDSELSDQKFEIQFVLDEANRILSEWTPFPGTETYRPDLANRLETLDGLIEQWKNGAITAEVAGGEFDRACQGLESEVENLAKAASAEGLTEETLDVIGEELDKNMSILIEELEAARPVNEEPGMSRKNPYPVSQVVSAPDWDIQVLEIKRGEEAWQMIQAANSFNEPPPEGYEYLLIRARVKNTSTVDEEGSIDGTAFTLTGSRLVQYGYLSVVAPEPVLDAKLFPGGETEGWVPLMAAQGETNLILVFQEMFSFKEGSARFIALDEGASLSVPADLAGIQPTELGITRETTAPKGEMVITPDWEVTVLELKRGDEAWQMIQENNQYAEVAPEGMEYALAMVKVHYIGSSATADYIGSGAFKTTGSSNNLHDFPWIPVPNPALETFLFPGGQMQGWVPLQVEKGETGLILVFDPNMGFDDEQRRYLSLE